ncbi:CFEM domain-containing protein [Hypoxylon sp. FL1284]|nr:CFEM domain-containing protein [Hypoxylon sp. FL1284]
MPFILFVLAMLASLASGQLQYLPKCGLDCITNAVLNSTWSPTDTPCICANAALQGHAHQRVTSSCAVLELLATLNITNAQCGIVSGHDRSWMLPMILFIVLGGIIFVLRLVSRIVCHMKLWWDDFFNLLAMLGCVAYSAVCLVTANLGLGTEIWAVPQENFTTLLKVRLSPLLTSHPPSLTEPSSHTSESMIYSWCEFALRTSVLLFYTRVFATGTGPRRTCWIVLIVSDVLGLGCLLFNIFQCTPANYFWLQLDGENEGHCIDANKVYLAGGVIGLFWTLLILVIPLPHILRLKLPPHKKFAATVMFAWGICTIAVMGYRFTTISAYNFGRNPSIEGIGVTLWSGIELDVPLICACMPSVYPLFLRLMHRGRQSPETPVPHSSVTTIGGSGGKRRGPWSYPSMTRLTVTSLYEEDTSTRQSSGGYVELDEKLTP